MSDQPKKNVRVLIFGAVILAMGWVLYSLFGASSMKTPENLAPPSNSVKSEGSPSVEGCRLDTTNPCPTSFPLPSPTTHL